jgi:hypothetical protein
MARWTALLLIPLLAGCVNGPSRGSDTGAKATTIDPAKATPRYWMDKPATAHADGSNYDRVWLACDAATRHYHFIPDVLNYRQGIMTSKPLVSKGVGEFWRNDVLDSDDRTKSTIATYRRTIRYDIEKKDDGRYEVDVKVLVERSSQFERRVTTGIQFRDSFGPYPPSAEFRSDDGAKQEAQYWYAVGRDETLEKALAQVIDETLAHK